MLSGAPSFLRFWSQRRSSVSIGTQCRHYVSLWYSSYLCIGFMLWGQISSYPWSVLACCDLCSSQTIRCLCLLLHLCSYDVRLEYLCVNTSLSSWFVLTECCQGRLVHLFDQLQRPPPPITPVECFCHHYFPLSWVSSFNTSETCTNLLDPYDAIIIYKSEFSLQWKRKHFHYIKRHTHYIIVCKKWANEVFFLWIYTCYSLSLEYQWQRMSKRKNKTTGRSQESDKITKTNTKKIPNQSVIPVWGGSIGQN